MIPKFRAWDKEEAVMFSVNQIFLTTETSIHGLGVLDEHNDFHSMDSIYLMQFTGLKDRDGKEIYEGDIFGKLFQLRCVVERIDDGAWKLVFLDKRIHPWPITDSRIAHSDVIGNIHEHPELLEENPK